MSDVPAVYRDAVRFSFGDTPELADRILALVLAGVKTASCDRVSFFGPSEPTPEPGRRDVVLDGQGRPAAVIETVSVTIHRFCDVPEEFMLAEGEGDVRDWREGHERYFARTGGFSPDMELVCERFRLVEVLPRPDAAETVRGWRPGLLGAIVRLHGEHYASQWNLPLGFEAEMATLLAGFARRYDPARDLVLSVWEGPALLATATLDGSDPEHPAGTARLRWVIASPAAGGRGLGRRLIDEALAFADGAGFGRVYLTTFDGLDPARRRYEAAGFRLVATRPETDWDRPLTGQRFERLRP